MTKKQPRTNYPFKFSFVIPVYNVESYLDETVDSLINQTMDFKSNCEIIFVNDGSKDNSEDVCLRYKERFPRNITYVKQKNAGPGAARNKGIALAKGKYINPIDSDDKLSPDTLEEVYKFFEEHYEEIDVIGIKWEFFDARRGPHPLNYRFTADRVIDLKTEYDAIQGSVATAFFKNTTLKKYRFDPKVGKYSEDGRFMSEVLLNKQRYGVVTKPTYFYRKRRNQTSSQDGNLIDKFWYLETPKRAWVDLFDYARKHNHGTIPKYIQFQVMYDLQWRFKQSRQTVLSDKELAEYKAMLFGMLKEIDDDVILAQRQIYVEHKIFLLGKKYNEAVLSKAKRRGTEFYYRGQLIYSFDKSKPPLHVEALDIMEDKIIIEGFFNSFLFSGTKLHLGVGKTRYDVQPRENTHRRVDFLGEPVYGRNHFSAVLPLTHDTHIEAYCNIGNKDVPLNMLMHRFSYLSPHNAAAYRVCNGTIITKRTAGLFIRRRSALLRLKSELIYSLVLAKRLKLRIVKHCFSQWRQRGGFVSEQGMANKLRSLRWLLIPAKSMVRNAYALSFRFAYFAVKPFYRKPIWLVSDRMTAADDNGEVFFRYLSRRKDVPVNVYFLLSKKSGEYERVKRYGKVVDYNSVYHKLLFLLADKVISSEATEYVINPFGGVLSDLIDLYHFDFVFLQHGIIKDDISGWLNRYNKNIKLFVTSTKPEYKSIIDGNYAYGPDVVKLTGLPRYDLLESKPKNKLILAPTWRENLVGGVDSYTGRRLHNPDFKQSDYFQFYQSLMNDRRLWKAMEARGYKGELYLHPSFQQQTGDFTGNKHFVVKEMPHDYPKAKREGSVLVTDYSSVAFDFAYLKKPVIYTQFDAHTFYKLHTSKEGYFSYEENGFGKVVYDYESTVREIIRTLEGGCKMHKKYQDRVDQFFYKFDKNNSERVYDAIMAMDADK